MSYLPVFKRTYILQATILTQLYQITTKITIKTFYWKFFFYNNYIFIVLVEIKLRMLICFHPYIVWNLVIPLSWFWIQKFWRFILLDLFSWKNEKCKCLIFYSLLLLHIIFIAWYSNTCSIWRVLQCFTPPIFIFKSILQINNHKHLKKLSNIFAISTSQISRAVLFKKVMNSIIYWFYFFSI